jgi:hypothetical protein
MSVNPVVRRLRQEDCKFQASLSHAGRSLSKKKIQILTISHKNVSVETH